MDELFRIIEDKIRTAGYAGPVDGLEIYEEICDQMEDKENGTYLFLSKHQDGSVIEYQVEIMDEQFNLSYIEIRTGGAVYRADFDSAN